MSSDSEQKHTLPGPKRKQAWVLDENIRWLVETFGRERIGFLTLTVGDETPDGFVKVDKRAEASRRFNSLWNKFRNRYQCGVIVTERHKDGGLHFHLVVAMGRDIRGEIDFEAVFPRRVKGRPVHAPDYSTANDALKLEWKYLRETLPRFGFGRHQMQPMRASAEALSTYVAKYISKSWEARCEDDRGGRVVRYFGRWNKDGHKFAPPWSARLGTLTPQARAWRECCIQVALAMRLQGITGFTEGNAKTNMGRRWAWNMTKRIRATEFFVRPGIHPTTREGMTAHNAEVAEEWSDTRRGAMHVGRQSWETWFKDEAEESMLNRAHWRARRDNRAALRAHRAEREKIAALRESLGVGQPMSDAVNSGVARAEEETTQGQQPR